MESVANALKAEGLEIYDFRERDGQVEPFRWHEINPESRCWSAREIESSLNHPAAVASFARDVHALLAADVLVLVLPCGRSAHLEMGYAAGLGKPTLVLLDDGEPELMYRLASQICTTLEDLLIALRELGTQAAR